jgi:PIN domain nuclease of toxin-antitoxin system
MAIKVSLGKLRIDLPRFCRAATDSGFEWLEIREAHLLKLAQLPLQETHKDPFDRLLIAQCQSEPLFLITADQALGAYGNLVIVNG